MKTTYRHWGIIPPSWKLKEKVSIYVPINNYYPSILFATSLDLLPQRVKRLKQAESLLWSGKVDETIAWFSTLKKKQATYFCLYLNNHRSRIINYNYYQQEKICSIGSGAVESTVKQIPRRLKISGATMECRKYSSSS